MKYFKTTLLLVCFTFASSLLYGQSIKYIPKDAELVLSIDYKTIMLKAGTDNIKRLFESIYTPFEVMALVKNSKSIGINPKDKIRVVLSSSSVADKKRHERYYMACIIPLQNADLFQNFVDNKLQDVSGMYFETVEYENCKLIKFIIKDYYNEEYYSEDSVTIEEYHDEDTIIFADDNEESDYNSNDSSLCEILQNNNGYAQFYIAYNKDVAIIATSENMAKNIFDQKQAFSSMEFESLQREKHDVDLWMKSSFLFETMLNDLYGFSDMNISKSIYIKDSIVTMTLDFLKGKSVMNVNQITPNAPDMRKIVKKTDENICKYFDDKSGLGFISFSLNLDEYCAIFEQDEFTKYIIKNMLGFSIDTIAEEYGFKIKDIFEILSGDIFISVDEKMSFTISVGIKDKERFKILFDKVIEAGVVIKDEENDIRIYQSCCSSPYALKYEDKMLHITSIKNIYTKSSPVKKQPAYISNIANGNIVGLYVNLEKVIDIFFGSFELRGKTNRFNVFDNFTLKSNVLGASEIKTTLEINMKNKSKNSLETILSLINDTLR